MFREVARKKQALSKDECLALLGQEVRGVLSVAGDDGYPYGMPINYWMDPETGFLYFHTGRKGHRPDALARCDKVSFCVYDSGVRKEGDWALTFRSVIVFGRVHEVADREEAIEITRKLSRRFIQDEAYIEEEIRTAGARVQVLVLEPEHITGKTVHEA